MRRRLIGDNGRAVCSAVSFFIQDSKTRKSENYDYQPGKFIIHYTEFPAKGQSSFGRDLCMNGARMKPGLCPQRQHALPSLSLTVSPASHHATSGTEAARAGQKHGGIRQGLPFPPGTQERGDKKHGRGRQPARPPPSVCHDCSRKNVCFRGDYSPNAFLAPSLSGLTSSTFLKYWSASSLLPFLE